MFRKRVSAVVLLLLLAASVSAQVNEVSDYIKAEMTRQRIPAVSLAVPFLHKFWILLNPDH